jgi:polyphosphate kinase 2
VTAYTVDAPTTDLLPVIVDVIAGLDTVWRQITDIRSVCRVKPELGQSTMAKRDTSTRLRKQKEEIRKAKVRKTTGPQQAKTQAKRKRISNAFYERELAKLQIELVKMQEWVKFKGLKVVAIFEGRDAAGKGGVIKRIMERMNPRICRVEALGTPTEREKTQWYFQRYVPVLPAAGEIVLFDRSWYNRAGVERVMGFCTEEQYQEFLRSCPEFERMLVRENTILIKYWFSVSDEVQEARFQARVNDPVKRWKLSPMDLESRDRWEEYSRAKDEMFAYTDIKQAPWYVVDADVKKLARLNCIRHFLSMIPYEDLTPERIELKPRKKAMGYVRPPITDQTFVEDYYGAEYERQRSEKKQPVAKPAS